MLVALPALVFGVPALLGHAVLPGDDITQNLPLRVLAGREIRSGHLPLFDAYSWSGTPLLAGWNAGAAYPFTWLFALLPAITAWTAGLIATWATAGAGLFAFLRALRLGSLPAFLGALSFSLAGAMSAQVTHFGLVAGMSWVPLALLAVLRLSSRTDSGDSPASARLRRLRWTAVLALAIGLMILAGEPRAIVDGCAVIGLYAAWQVWRVWRVRRVRRPALPAALSIGSGILLGTGLGAVQWLPGLATISTSQRGSGSMALFSAGSLPPRWLFLTLIPDLLGGSGTLSQPSFFASYNLTEVTSYVGILPLVAAFALLARALPALRRRAPDWLIWHGVAVAGIALALGGDSPLGRVLYHLPLFGSQRLQSRNILLLDLALAVLLAYWLDQPFPERARRFSLSRLETLAGLLPPIAVLALVTAALAWGAGLLSWLSAGPGSGAGTIGQLRPWLLPYAVLAAAAIALVIFGRRLSRKGWARACAGFVVVDVVVFTLLAVVKVAPSGAAPGPPPTAPAPAGASGAAGGAQLTRAVSAPAAAPAAARPVSALGYPGRFAIYDPDLLDGADLSALEPPDVNAMTADGIPSVQGYSSIVDGDYASATGSHSADGQGQNVLSPAAIGNGTLDAVDTSVLLTLPDYLTTTTGPSGLGRRGLETGQSTAWYLGESVAVSRISVPDATARADAASGTELGIMTPDGAARWFRARAASPGALEISLPRPAAATAVLGRADGAVRANGAAGASGAVRALGAPSVHLADGRVLFADGALQDDLAPPRWNMAGFDGGFAVFTDRFASGPLTVQSLPGASGRRGSGADRASVQYVTSAPGDVTSATVSSAHGVRLVRSMAAIPGWSAIWHPRNGQPTALSVQRDGIVQAVDVPPGQGTVTWRYTTPRFGAGLAISAIATLVTACLLTGCGLRRKGVRTAPRREHELQAA